MTQVVQYSDAEKKVLSKSVVYSTYLFLFQLFLFPDSDSKWTKPGCKNVKKCLRSAPAELMPDCFMGTGTVCTSRRNWSLRTLTTARLTMRSSDASPVCLPLCCPTRTELNWTEWVAATKRKPEKTLRQFYRPEHQEFSFGDQNIKISHSLLYNLFCWSIKLPNE